VPLLSDEIAIHLQVEFNKNTITGMAESEQE
jgi:hypothetical protein